MKEMLLNALGRVSYLSHFLSLREGQDLEASSGTYETDFYGNYYGRLKFLSVSAPPAQES